MMKIFVTIIFIAVIQSILLFTYYKVHYVLGTAEMVRFIKVYVWVCLYMQQSYRCAQGEPFQSDILLKLNPMWSSTAAQTGSVGKACCPLFPHTQALLTILPIFSRMCAFLEVLLIWFEKKSNGT